MPIRTGPRTQVTVNNVLVPSTTANTCPGWADALCVGIFPENGTTICRPCEPGKEMWLSLETDINFGICACLPRPVAGWERHGENIVSVIFLILLYCLMFGDLGRRIRRRLI